MALYSGRLTKPSCTICMRSAFGLSMSTSYEPKYQIKVPNKAKYQTKHQTTRFLVCCFKHSGLCKGNCII